MPRRPTFSPYETSSELCSSRRPCSQKRLSTRAQNNGKRHSWRCVARISCCSGESWSSSSLVSSAAAAGASATRLVIRSESGGEPTLRKPRSTAIRANWATERSLACRITWNAHGRQARARLLRRLTRPMQRLTRPLSWPMQRCFLRMSDSNLPPLVHLQRPR